MVERVFYEGKCLELVVNVPKGVFADEPDNDSRGLVAAHKREEGIAKIVV